MGRHPKPVTIAASRIAKEVRRQRLGRLHRKFKMKARFADLGGYAPFTSSPIELRKFIADDVEKMGHVRAR
jgi:hypothetical protein